jgi:pimeloyl-ACP methyl ester carboxylesterase
VTIRSHLDGVVFADHLAGEPPRVLALHGWGRDRRDLAGVLNGRATIAVDLPGFGASPPPPAVWGGEEYARAMAELLDEVREGDERFVVVGHSRGGCIAACLAAARPELVSGVVLVGAPVLRLSAPRPPALWYRALRAGAARGILPDSLLERVRERRGSADYRAARGIMRDVLVRVVSETYESQLRAVDCPVGLCWGADDHDVPPAVATQAQPMLHDCVAIEIVARAGHDVQRDDPAALRSVVDRVVERAARRVGDE